MSGAHSVPSRFNRLKEQGRVKQVVLVAFVLWFVGHRVESSYGRGEG